MKEIIFSTGNLEKFLTAKHVCDNHDITLIQKKADIVEIQSKNPESVALDKAAKAFAIVKQPVVVTDDSWAFSGLKGFPGIYMHYINEWLTPEDFLRLTFTLSDRKVVLTQYLVYDDGKQQKVFRMHIQGELLKEIRGSSKQSSHTIITLSGDNGLSIAEVYGQTTNKSTRKPAQVWHDFAEWYKNQ